MCGILGLYQAHGQQVDPATLLRMMNAQRHRGPDDQGARLFSLRRGAAASWEPSGPAPDPQGFEGAVGFNRLSILDLTHSGHQPMCNGDGSVFIVFNGEIYNAFDHRPELESAGYRFRSRTDTEVILGLYEHLGLRKTLDRLNGMFALCIVDLRSHSLFLARDRLGIKPLYWYDDGRVFLFSSEVKSFLHHPAFRAELQPERLDEYFMFRYCAGEGFLLKGVRQLEPGCWLKLTPQGIETGRYWEIPAGGQRDIGLNAGVDELQEHVQRSVRMQLLSDVKVGCQLSGGIDSSLVNVYAARHGAAQMDAFSITFDDPRFSEERWIDVAVSKSGVKSHKFPLDRRYVAEHFALATWYLDQPLNHPNSIGIYCLADHARHLVTVLLSGEGADELFCGYVRFLYAAIRPRVLPFMPLLGRVPRVGGRLREKFGGDSGEDDIDWFLRQTAYLSAPRLHEIRPDARPRDVLDRRRGMFEGGSGDFLRDCQRYELATYLVDLLVRQDKMTMAHSMENRVPFLDHELVEFVRTLPMDHLVRVRPGRNDLRMVNTKVNLKRLALRHFDEEFVFRPKIGFDLPLADYFKDPAFGRLLEERILPGMRRRGIVDTAVVERWWRESGTANDPLWICVAFETWAQQFLDGERPQVAQPREPRTLVGSEQRLPERLG